jgi:hypothetical protein
MHGSGQLNPRLYPVTEERMPLDDSEIRQTAETWIQLYYLP